jgi:predicted Rossmann fold nucleotide-binding protein DprA/Smf involved in DNA uptake
MEIIQVHNDSLDYPAALQLFLGNNAPKTITAFGDFDLLTNKALAFFCSIKCPGNLILQTYDLAQKLRQSTVTVIGGFHSPVERECLTILLRLTNPIIICVARGIESMRIPAEYKKPLAEGRLLLLSPFGVKQHRATVEMASYRNEVVAALAEQIFVAYAEPSGKTEQFCRRVIEWQKPFYTFASDINTNLISLGAKAIHKTNEAIL